MTITTKFNIGSPVYYLRRNGVITNANVLKIKAETNNNDNAQVHYILSDDLSIERPEGILFDTREALVKSISAEPDAPAKTTAVKTN